MPGQFRLMLKADSTCQVLLLSRSCLGPVVLWCLISITDQLRVRARQVIPRMSTMTARPIRKLELLDLEAICPPFDPQLEHFSAIRTLCPLSYLLDCMSDCRHGPPFRGTEAGLEGAPP